MKITMSMIKRAYDYNQAIERNKHMLPSLDPDQYEYWAHQGDSYIQWLVRNFFAAIDALWEDPDFHVGIHNRILNARSWAELEAYAKSIGIQ